MNWDNGNEHGNYYLGFRVWGLEFRVRGSRLCGFGVKVLKEPSSA